jgi:hypothetical protein
MNFHDYKRQIFEFFEENGLEIKPFPTVVFEKTEVDILNPFIKTGHYNPNTKEIVLNIHNRHLKDILRTFCHELVHHHQNVAKNRFENIDLDGKLSENPQLEELESEAYQLGNIIFRKWTEKIS